MDGWIDGLNSSRGSWKNWSDRLVRVSLHWTVSVGSNVTRTVSVDDSRRLEVHQPGLHNCDKVSGPVSVKRFAETRAAEPQSGPAKQGGALA